MSPQSLLQKQLEEQRFLHGIAYVEQAARGLKKITTSELARLNNILTGESTEPWRFEAASVKIPSGRTHQFNVLSNPVDSARNLLGNSQQLAGNQDFFESAFRLYSQLVLCHLFRDANRRTAALATLWVLLSHGQDIDANRLADLVIGDLREPAAVDKLKSEIHDLLK